MVARGVGCGNHQDPLGRPGEDEPHPYYTWGRARVFGVNGEYIAPFCFGGDEGLQRVLDTGCSEAVCAQREGEFASVVQVVFDDVPDHPLT